MMKLQESDLRNIIQKIIKESFKELDESNKGNQFNSYLDFAFENITPNIPGQKFENIEILQKARTLINNKLSKVFMKDFEYKDFIIVKLGKFVLNDNGVREVLTFSKTGDEEKGYSYMYLYVYKNIVELIRFGSSFFQNDDLLLKEVKTYIQNKGIKLITKTETGKIDVDNSFERDNIIDVTDYSKVERPETKKIERFGELFDKSKNYKVGDSFLHKNLGPGKVVKTKRVVAEIPTIDVSVQFKSGEQKRFRLEKPMMSQTQSQEL